METQEQGQGQGQGQERGLGPEPQPAGPAGAVDLGKVRELVLLAYPDVVHEMVEGPTLEALLASVQPAKAAYERIVEQARQRQQAGGSMSSAPAAPSVPAGQPGRHFVINIEELSPHSKIVEGLRQRDKSGS